MPPPSIGAIVPAVPFPRPVDPPTGFGVSRLAFTIDAVWLPYLIGCAKVLTANSTYDPPLPDPAILAVQMAYSLLRDLSNAVPVSPLPDVPGCGGCDCEGCMSVRFNGCVLQQYDCITQSWVDVPTIGVCAPNPAPGGGTTPPSGGGCQAYSMKFLARDLTPLPFLVNTADTIQITSLTGAGSDGTPDWFCPDGSFFIAGACAGGGGPVSGDPLAMAPHMSVVLKIGSTYYPFVSGTFTVPSAIVNQPVYIGVNDASLSDDSGEYSLAMNYCNNQTPPATGWCQALDLTVSPNGIVSYTVNDGCPAPVNVANWQTGNGWVVPAYTISCSPPTTQFQGTIALDLGVSTTITSVELKGNYAGSATGSRFIDVGLNTTPPWSSSVLHPISVAGYAAGAFDLLSGAISQLCRYIQIDIADTSHGTPAGTPGYTLTKLVLKGTGVNPFGSSNC